MKKISIIILLMIGLSSLLLTGCEEVGITPEIDSEDSKYQGDTTKPVITGSPAPLPNSFGWNNTDVTVSFSCADTGAVQSGIDINTVAGVTLTTEGKDQSVTNTGNCIDVAGNIADPVTVSNINIDKTPPVVMITLPGTGEYVLNQSITAIWFATDALSGVVSPVSGSVSIDTSSVGTKTFTMPAGTVMDKAGNSSLKVTISYSVIFAIYYFEVDTTKPVITGSRAPLPNSFGWNNTDVTVSFSCADTGSVQSGIDINTVAGKTLITEGKDQSVTNTGTCIDVAGNIADPVTVSNINIDKTPPVVTITLPGTGEYVLNQSITATWSATDALSGVISPVSGSVSINTSSVGTKTFTLPAGTVTDKAGNSSLEVTISYSVIEDVEVDTTKPVITGSRDPLPNSFGWNNTDVTVSFSCADTGSVQSGIDINTVAGATLTTEGKDQSVTNTGTCIDVAGNIADPVTVSNINIDKTPPVVTITLPGTGEYVLNQSITTTWSATDALSGVVSPVSGSVSIDTSSVGTKTFTLPAGTAKDKAGNSSLEVTISYSVIENTEEPVMWSGLGMNIFPTSDNTWGLSSSFEERVDELLANGFTQLRIGVNYWAEASAVAIAKSAVTLAVSKGAEVIWGVGSGAGTITATNWLGYRQAILNNAQWAQDNGVYEFQLGNEEEVHVDGSTMTGEQMIINLKDVATEVQAIFTRGNISYSFGWGYDVDWIAAGKGDIDIIAYNLYMGGDGTYTYPWKSDIDNLINAFGVDGTYLTEFGPSSSPLDDYSTDEAVQAAAVTEMIEYIKASGMKRAIFFCYYDDSRPFGPEGFGIVKTDGNYRLLWSQALLNSDSVKFATVPTKTTTASLPGAIALISSITR